MGWSIGFDYRWERDIGYGVPAYCDHPDCNAEIDRGLSYVCGSEPKGGDRGCGLYFCEQHRCHCVPEDSEEDIETDNPEVHFVSVCDRCAEGKPPFDPKPEHPEWIQFKMTDPSWAEWRKENGYASSKA
jgi:hypothetical protein